MSTHSRPFKVTCDERGCRSVASEEVFNTYNASQGKYCLRHAKARVAELKRGERAAETEAP